MFFLPRSGSARNLLSLPTIRWLVISRFFADLFFYSTTIVLFQQERGLDFTQMFLMETILSGAIWCAELPTGFLADRFGYARLILLGRALNLLGMILFTWAYGFWLFALSNVLGGLAIACVSGCESALLYSALAPEQRGTQGSSAFVMLRSASSAGFFIGLLTGSFVGAYSPTLAVSLSLLPLVLSLCAALRLNTVALPDRDQQTQTNTAAREIVRLTWHTLRGQPLLVGLSLLSSTAFAFTNAIFWYNQPYFARAGIAIWLFGPLTAGAMALQFFLLFRLPIFQKRLGTGLLLTLSCLLPGLCYLLLSRTQATLPTVGLVAGVITFSAWQQPVVDNELNRRIPDQSRATLLSTLSLSGAFLSILLNPLIGHLGDLGLPVVGYGLGIGLILSGLLAPWLLRYQKPVSEG